MYSPLLPCMDILKQSIGLLMARFQQRENLKFSNCYNQHNHIYTIPSLIIKGMVDVSRRSQSNVR